MSSSADSSLILPSDSAGDTVDAMIARLPEVVWLRNPKTGVIYKYLKSSMADSIRHALQGETGEGGRKPFTLSTEEAAREQAIELAKLQGRPLPPWAVTVEPEPVGLKPAAAVTTAKGK